jgi:hypothetical protein
VPLLGPTGQEIATFKKASPPKLGPAFGDWAGRDATYNTMPGGAILTFNLDALTLEDYRAMRSHPQIAASLSLLTFVIHQIEWHIEADQEKVATAIEENLRPLWTRLVRALSQAFWAGYSPIILEWENNVQERRIDVAKFKDMRPEECEVHWKEVEGWAPPNHVKPKFKIYDGIVDRRYAGADRIRRGPVRRLEGDGEPTTSPDQYHIPPENTLWYPLLMENGDFYGRKLLKSAFAPWYFSQIIHLFANRYYERFGEPVPMGRYPEGADVELEGSMVSARTAMEVILNNLRNRSVVMLPSDRQPTGPNSSEYEYTLEYLESQMRGADFERYLTRLDEEISMSLFTPILLMRTGDVGSHNLGVQHAQNWFLMVNALAGDIKEYIDRYVVTRLRDYNFGPNAGRAEWVPKRLGKENVETIRAITTELLRAGKVGFDPTELGEFLGMTVKEVRQVLDPETGQPRPESDDEREREDERIGRDKPDRGAGRPRGAGEPRATGREIANRLKGQVTKAFRDGTFGTNKFKPSLGYERRMEHSFVAAGMNEDAAAAATRRIYEQTERWLADAAGLGAAEFAGPEDFMSLFNRLLDSQVEDALA